MVIYVDVLLVINYIMDLILLICVNKILKRQASFRRIFLASFIGELSLIFLVLDINKIMMLGIRVLSSTMMCIISFRAKSFHYVLENIIYFYMLGTITAGCCYFLYLISEAYFIYVILVVLFGPLSAYLFMKLYKRRVVYQHLYTGYIEFYKGKIVFLNMYLDTGNKLIEPFTHRPIILVRDGLIPTYDYCTIYVPFNTLNGHGLLKCIRVCNIFVEGKKIQNCYVGVSNNNLMNGTTDCILNIKCLEEL